MQIRLGRLTGLFLVLLAPLMAEDNLKFGQPACAEPVLDKDFFVVCYDPAHKVPVWVGYALTKADSLKKATSRTGSFRADAALLRGNRAVFPELNQVHEDALRQGPRMLDRKMVHDLVGVAAEGAAETAEPTSCDIISQTCFRSRNS